MSDKGTIEQLRAELAQARRQLAIPDQLCGYCGYQYSTGTNEVNFAVMAEHIKSCPEHPLAKALAELAQARAELATVDKSLGEFYCPVLNPETGEECGVYFRDHGVMDMRYELQRQQDDAEEMRQQLAQARTELKDLHETDHEFGLRRNRDYWYDKAVAAECERDEWRKKAQEQSDEVQGHWLSPVEAEGLRRQLALMDAERETWLKEADALEMKLDNAAEGEAAIVEAAEALLKQPYIFVGNPAESTMEIAAASKKLQAALEHRSDAAAKLLERLATLDAAEAALAKCGLGSLETQFDGLPGAIDGMAEHIKELSGQLSEAELAAHVLRESSFVLAQNVRTERALRQEAEQETRRCNIALSATRAEAKATQTLLDNVNAELSNGHKAFTGAGVPRDNRWGKMSITGRVAQMRIMAEQRAERAEALAASTREAVEWLWGFFDGNTLVARPGYEDDIREAWDRLLAATDGVETVSLLDRLESAEALAALVTPELAALLEHLAKHVPYTLYTGTGPGRATQARELAAQIREALDDSQA